MTARAFAGALALVALAGAGCGGVETRAVAFRPPPGPAGARADVYVASVPARPYYEIGLVQAVGTGEGAARGPLVRALRERGRRMGCDAVVRANVELGQTVAHAIGVCVRWAEVDALPRAAPPEPATSTPAGPAEPGGE